MSELSIVNAIEESIGSPEGGPFDYQMGVAMELGLWKRHGEKMFLQDRLNEYCIIGEKV